MCWLLGLPSSLFPARQLTKCQFHLLLHLLLLLMRLLLSADGLLDVLWALIGVPQLLGILISIDCGEHTVLLLYVVLDCSDCCCWVALHCSLGELG
jgi:hypothetical protein